MATKDFQAFAAAGGANVISQAAYLALAELSTGFETGTALSNELNKVWRQATFVAAMLMSFISDTANVDTLDDGDLPGAQAKLVQALTVILGATVVVSTATGLALTDNRKAFVSNGTTTPNATFTIARTTTLLATWRTTIFARGGDVTLAIDSHDSINGGTAGVGTLVPKNYFAEIESDGAGGLWVVIMPTNGLSKFPTSIVTYGGNTGVSGNFTVPAGVTQLRLKMVGAGAGGTDGNTTAGNISGAGGGAGAYAEGLITVVPGNSYAYTVGGGGVGQRGRGGADAGGNTSFSSLTAPGGSPASVGAAPHLGGSGGGASSASFTFVSNGGDGGAGTILAPAATNNAGSYLPGGSGGVSFYGGGVGNGNTAYNFNVNPGMGAPGGPGVFNGSIPATGWGSNGSSGLLIIEF